MRKCRTVRQIETVVFFVILSILIEQIQITNTVFGQTGYSKRTYFNQKLGLQFQYPSPWGEAFDSDRSRKKQQDALSVRRVKEANSMDRQREDVRLEDEISKQMDDITTKTLKKTKDMDTFERKAQEIRLTKPLSPETLGMGKKFKRRKKSSVTKNNSQ
jgi:hypothetical protein